MQTNLFSRVFSAFVPFVPAGSGPVTSVVAPSRAGGSPVATSLAGDLARVNDLSTSELSNLLARLAVRSPGDQFTTDHSATAALNILSGNVGSAMAPAQAARWAREWLQRPMSDFMADVRACLADDNGDGLGRFYAGCIRDLLMLRDSVREEDFAADVLATFTLMH